MLDKLDMVKKARQDIANLVTAINEEDKKLDYAYKELSRLRDYKVIYPWMDYRRLSINCRIEYNMRGKIT